MKKSELNEFIKTFVGALILFSALALAICLPSMIGGPLF